MDIHKLALRVLRDVVNIVLAWNERRLTDKQAMERVAASVLPDEEYDLIADTTKKHKKSISIKFHKKSPLLFAIVGGLVLISFGVGFFFDSFPSAETIRHVAQEPIEFEQLGEIFFEDEEKIQGEPVIEDFTNKTTNFTGG